MQEAESQVVAEKTQERLTSGMQNDEIRFVQFMHPGPESEPGPDGWKPWTPRLESHRRTFVSNPGRFRRSLEASRAESAQEPGKAPSKEDVQTGIGFVAQEERH